MISPPPAESRFLARTPVQARARERMQRICAEAEKLLLGAGLSGFSIPLLAERLDCPRSTIYKFFPTPYAVLNALAEMHLDALELHLRSAAPTLAQMPWREAARTMVTMAADYYRQHPVACLLLLGGHATDESFRAMEYTINRLGRLMHDMLLTARLWLDLETPNESALAIEFATTCFRVSHFLHHEITPAYVEAGADAMIAFIEKRARPTS